MVKDSKKKWFRLYGDVVLVRGKRCSALYDLQRGRLSIISHAYHDIIEWLHLLPSKHRRPCPSPTEQVMKCQSSFIASGYGRLTATPERFQTIPLSFHAVDPIQHAVVDYALGTTRYLLGDVLAQLDEIGCNHLEIRLPEYWTVSDLLEELGNDLANTEFSSLHLVMRYREGTETEPLFNSVPHLSRITFRVSPQEGKVKKGYRKVHYQTGTMDPIPSLPKMPRIISRRFFSEALSYNPYYNRRLCIDRWGNIKNDLNLEKSYGHVCQQSIDQIYTLSDFRELWTVNADQIDTVNEDPCRYAICPMVPLEKLTNSDLYKIATPLPNYEFY